MWASHNNWAESNRARSICARSTLAAFLALAVSFGEGAVAQTEPSSPVSTSQPASATSHASRNDRERELAATIASEPTDTDAWRDYIAIAIDDGRLAIAVQRFRRAAEHVRPTPEMHHLVAEAFAGLGLWLGKPETRVIHDGRVGQFAGDWLPIEKLSGLDRFRCVPAGSALYHVRRALDGGFQKLEAYVLHARAWLAAGDLTTAWQIVDSQKSRLSEDGNARLLGEVVDIAIACNHVPEALRFAQTRVDRQPEQRGAILFDAYVRCAERCGLAGDDVLYRDLLTRAAELRPKDAQIALRVADAEYEAGNRGLARDWYRRVIDLAPEHTARARILQRIAE